MSQENTTSKQPLIRYVNRQQMSWRAVDVEHLIGEDHPARAIWALVGRLNLSAFYRAIESSTEEGGRPAFEFGYKKWQTGLIRETIGSGNREPSGSQAGRAIQNLLSSS